MTLFPRSSPHKNRMLLRQFQVSITRKSKLSLFKVTDILTYETEFFVDFIIRGLYSAACVHFDTFCGRVRVLTSFAVRQQKVFRQNCVASSKNNKVSLSNWGVQLTFSIAVGIDCV